MNTIKADSFLGPDRQSAFFDVRDFNPHVQSYRDLTLASCLKKHEQEKRRAHEQRVWASGAWMFLGTGFCCVGWNGAHSEGGVQENVKHCCSEV